jgi:hypothetical protein
MHSDRDIILASLEELFRVYGRINDFRIAGAESFLHPDIEEIILAASKYSQQYGFMCIVTNGTYVPRQSILQVIESLPGKFVLRVDDYGKHSVKLLELISELKNYDINVDLRQYNEQEQAFGGWIDLGDYEYKNYSEQELRRVFYTCKMPNDCVILWDGKLYICPYCVCGHKLGKTPISEREYVDLLDGSAIEQKKEKLTNWKQQPLLACAYCNGYDPENSPRIPAAEQI